MRTTKVRLASRLAVTVAVAAGLSLAAHAQGRSEDQARQQSAQAEERLPLLRVPLSPLAPGDTSFGKTVEHPYAGDKEQFQTAVDQGEALFGAMNCNGCHAPLGGGGMGPSLSNDRWIYGGTAGDIYMSIVQGRPAGMPAWGGMLTEDATWALVAYVQTLNERKAASREGARQ